MIISSRKKDYDMDRKIHVSVIVPAHNEEKYVKRCIDSIKESASHFIGKQILII